MIWLLLSIVFTTCLLISFKIFDRLGINVFQAIVFNYFTAAAIGFIYNPSAISFTDTFTQNWTLYASILGLFFISVFYCISQTSLKLGISTASVANKMSLIIPVMIMVYTSDTILKPLQIAGIIMALLAVVLTSIRKKDSTAVPVKGVIFLPFIVFIGSGIIDAMIGYGEQTGLATPANFSIFVSMAFLTAGITGSVALVIALLNKKTTFSGKALLGGVCLGIPNFLSIYFLLKALESDFISNAIIIPVNNMGIVFTSAVAARLFFSERLSRMNIAGIALALASIFMIAFNDIENAF